MRLTDEQLLAAYRRIAAYGRPAVHLRIAMLEARLAEAARQEAGADARRGACRAVEEPA